MSADQPKSPPLRCTCLGDRYGAVPPELRPRPRKANGLRKVTCPGCGLRYWTNRSTDLCMDCEREGKPISAERVRPGTDRA